MKIDVPTGTTFYWNPYSPKFYTIVQSPTMGGSSRASSDGSDDEGSFQMNASYGAGSNASFDHGRKQGPSDEVYNLGWSTISSVRQEKTTDAAICTMVQRFPHKTLTAMAADMLPNWASRPVVLCVFWLSTITGPCPAMIT